MKLRLACLLVGSFFLGMAVQQLVLDGECRAESTHLIRLGGTPYYCLDAELLKAFLYSGYLDGLRDAANGVKGGT